MEPDEVSLCIPCYNVTDDLPRTLEAVGELDPAPARVVCVDDGSEDDIDGVLDEYKWVHLVRHDRNQGLAAARNTALSETDTEGMAMIDADVVVGPDWLGTLVDSLNDRGAAAVGGPLEESVDSLADKWRALHMSQHFGSEPHSREWIPGANALYETDALRDVGGWDGRYRTNYEDVDLCDRLVDAGYDVWYCPDAQATHHRSDSVSSVLATSWAWTYGYRDEPNRVSEVPHRFVEHVRRTGGEVFTDIDNKQWDLLPVSLLRPLVFTKEDIEAIIDG